MEISNIYFGLTIPIFLYHLFLMKKNRTTKNKNLFFALLALFCAAYIGIFSHLNTGNRHIDTFLPVFMFLAVVGQIYSLGSLFREISNETSRKVEIWLYAISGLCAAGYLIYVVLNARLSANLPTLPFLLISNSLLLAYIGNLFYQALSDKKIKSVPRMFLTLFEVFLFISIICGIFSQLLMNCLMVYIPLLLYIFSFALLNESWNTPETEIIAVDKNNNNGAHIIAASKTAKETQPESNDENTELISDTEEKYADDSSELTEHNKDSGDEAENNNNELPNLKDISDNDNTEKTSSSIKNDYGLPELESANNSEPSHEWRGDPKIKISSMKNDDDLPELKSANDSEPLEQKSYQVDDSFDNWMKNLHSEKRSNNNKNSSSPKISKEETPASQQEPTRQINQKEIAQTDNANNEKTPPHNPPAEKETDKSFTAQLRKYIAEYNSETKGMPAQSHLAERVYLNTETQDWKDFFLSLFAFVKRVPASTPYIDFLLTQGKKKIFLSVGNFDNSGISSNDSNILHLKRETEKLNGNFSLSPESNGQIIYIDFPNHYEAKQTEQPTTATKETRALQTSEEKNESDDDKQKAETNKNMILVISDDNKKFNFFSAYLSTQFRIVRADDPERGITLLCNAEKERPFDLAIIAMKNDKNNLNVCELIKNQAILAGVPLIFAVQSHQIYFDNSEKRHNPIEEIILPLKSEKLFACIEKLLSKPEISKENTTDTQPTPPQNVDITKITEKYQLSHNETVILTLLLRNMKPATICMRLKLSKERFLSIAKGIFQKTSTHSLDELFNLLRE